MAQQPPQQRHREHRPPTSGPGSEPPPPPPKGNGGNGPGRVLSHRTRLIGQAIGNLQSALLNRNVGLTPEQALTFAKVLLTRPGVTITKNGVRYQGTRYSAGDFATSPLADFVTGLKAKLDNQNAIKGDPGYLGDLATLGLNRDNATAGLQEQYDRAILNYGDPAFAGNNALLGAQAAHNPFSEAMLLSQAYRNAQSVDAQNAAARGLMPGSGGYAAAQSNTARAYAGQMAGQVQNLQDLLSTINAQRAQALSTYNVGQANALQSAEQRLLASGQIHAATAPNLGIGRYRLYRPPGQSQGTGVQGGRRVRPPNMIGVPPPPRLPRPTGFPRPPRPPRMG